MQISNNCNLIFLHIPKNGGNTLHTILNRMYKRESIFSIEVINNTRLNTNAFIDLSEIERAKIKVLKGHMLYGLHTHLVGKSNYITFLRKPEDRIISFYYYVKKRPNHRLYDFINDNSYSLYDFVTKVSEGDVHNAQIRWISGMEHGTEDEMLQQALTNIKNHFSFIGLQEKFDQSLILLSEFYKWGFPFYKYQNKGSYSNKNLLDEKTRLAIAERNKGDLKLYELMEKQFNDQLKKNAFINLKLKKLKIANAIYENKYLKYVFITKLKLIE